MKLDYRIEKLPSGSYRVRKQINGKRVTKTFSHEPNNKELTLAFADMIVEAKNAKPTKNKKTFSECASIYVKNRQNTLSPSTEGEYTLMPKRFSEEFQNLPIDDIRKEELTKEVNRMAKRLATKTIDNRIKFAMSVLRAYQTNFEDYDIHLPQKKKNIPYIPTSEEVKKILDEAEGTRYEIAIKLGCWGLRRSEIVCITSKDVEKVSIKKGKKQSEMYLLHINKAYVENKATKVWYVKSTKSTASERDIIITKEIADAIISKDKAYEGGIGSISKWMKRKQIKLGLPEFSLHKERHYFATNLAQMGVAPKDIQKMGGWASDHVMKTVYQHEQISKDLLTQKSISDKLHKRLS